MTSSSPYRDKSCVQGFKVYDIGYEMKGKTNDRHGLLEIDGFLFHSYKKYYKSYNIPFKEIEFMGIDLKTKSIRWGVSL